MTTKTIHMLLRIQEGIEVYEVLSKVHVRDFTALEHASQVSDLEDTHIFPDDKWMLLEYPMRVNLNRDNMMPEFTSHMLYGRKTMKIRKDTVIGFGEPEPDIVRMYDGFISRIVAMMENPDVLNAVSDLLKKVRQQGEIGGLKNLADTLDKIVTGENLKVDVAEVAIEMAEANAPEKKGGEGGSGGGGVLH